MLAVTILGIIVGPLASAIIVGLRTTGATTVRLANSNDQKLVTRRLNADLQYATSRVRGIDQGIDVADCPAEPAPPATVLTLGWTDETAPAVVDTYTVNYAISRTGDECRLLRAATKNSGATTVNVVAHNLAATGTPVQVNLCNPTGDCDASSVVANGRRVRIALTGAPASPTGPPGQPYVVIATGRADATP